MTYTEIDILEKKAKTRKDGVYSYGGYLYVVKDSKFIAFGNYFGGCYQRAGSFNVCIGEVDRYKMKEKLKEWLKQQ